MELTIPELTAVHVGLLALALVVGLVLGWVFRGERSAKEKIAVNAGWQDQLESLQAEQGRLAEQNKGLMEQISQYQNSQKESVNRSKELSESLKESFQRRDELQRQLGEFRSKLEAMVSQRDQLKETLDKQEAVNKSTAAGLKEKDDKIFHLSRELNSWQSRVPPLVEKFQQRDKEARALQDELQKAEDELKTARRQIESYEEMIKTNQTRIEPVEAGSLDGLDASNEPHTDTTAANLLANLEDQIDNTRDDVTPMEQAPTNTPDLPEIPGVPDSPEIPGTPAIPEIPDEPAPDLPDIPGAPETPEIPGEPGAASLGRAEDRGTEADDLIAADIFVDEDDTKEDTTEPPAKTTRRILEQDVAGEKDDLQQIKGVGPAIEKTLNDLGIYSFDQIAQMSEHEIDRVAQRVKGFRSRVYRQDWIGQARDLHSQKINNRP